MSDDTKYCECGCGAIVKNRFKRGHWMRINNPFPKGVFGTAGRNTQRTIAVWNEHHPDDLMPQKGYLIHHKDEDPENDDPNNLEKMTLAKHSSLHHLGKKLSKDYKRKISEANSGVNNPMYGKEHTKEARRKMAKNHADMSGENGSFYGRHHTKEARKKMSLAKKGYVPWNKGRKINGN